MALTALLVLSLALCSAQLHDELDLFERECLGEDRFLCAGGGCVAHNQYCDGFPDCPDGSDEDFCPNHLPDPALCNHTHHYLCLDQKKCIPNSWLCNNETECEDGSDEANCTVLDTTGVNSTCKGFQCDGNKCISKLWVCDGYYDCDDKSDEYSEETCRHARLSHSLHDAANCQETPNTGERNYRCLDNSFCLPKSMMCDGMPDCRDGSDEKAFCDQSNHLPDPALCNHTHHYLCLDQKKCIPNSWLCNNETECEDGSDEANCTVLDTTGVNSTCKGFQCDGNKCISKLWVCDGYYDCDDKSDEYSEETCRHARLSHSLHDAANCQETPNTGERNYRCLDNSFCLPKSMMCDGMPDCRDGSDEKAFCDQSNHLPDPALCNHTHHYLCLDQKKCIPNSWLCNNETECEDGSDEANCTVLDTTGVNSTCKGFQCDGNKCISKLWVCDGYYDCDDKSDEYSEETCRHARLSHSLHDAANCQETPNTGERNYRCLDNSFCLPKSMMCDGMPDCRDGSDEKAFCDQWATMCNNATEVCKGNTTCHPSRLGPTCACADSPNMRKYNYETHVCEDIDECAQPRPQCSHMCENRDGHFVCSCDQGYKRDVYQYLCYADGPEAILFFTTRTDIRYVKIKSKQGVVVTTGIKQAHGVSYDGKYLYWVETAQGHQAIMRAQFEDIEDTKEVLVSLGLEDPGDIAIDWMGGHIYFSDVHRGTISVCRTDGSICTTLHTDARQPRFVTLAVRYGQMYWADWHHRPVIMAARMDGSQAEVLVDSLRSFATGLAVDVPNGRLYYVDETIKVFKIDDKQSYSLFEEPFHHPYSIAVFENTVFWSDWTSNTIQTTDKLHGSSQKRFMLTSSDTPVYDMHVYHPVLFNHIRNPCENRTCSHLCLITSNTTAVCACPEGMSLHGDTCKHINGYRPLYLVLGGGSSFTRFEYNSLGNPESHTTHFDIGRVQAMAYDTFRDTLYIYDGQRKSIHFINMTDFTLGITHLLIYKGLENVVDMDYDFATDSLYIVDAGRRFIEVISLRSQQRAIITRFMDQEIPISICVMPDYGRMLVAVLDSEHGNSIHIDIIGLDGTGRQRILVNDLKGPRVLLRYDLNMDVVYIADEGNSIIDVIHPEGTGRENFRELSTTVTNIAVTDPYVFWTDRRTSLYWSNVHEATHNIRRIAFSIFPESAQLHIQATYPPPDSKNPLLAHPCLNTHPCSHICVQTPHAPLSPGRPNSSNPLQFKCLCPPSLLNVGGKCTELARCKVNELYCHRTNECVRKGTYCDGFKDCMHGEDEEDCEVNPAEETHGCSTGYKLCDSLCVDNNHICETDTPSTSSTTPAPRCSSTEFECANSSICIERSQMCDGHPDCLNGSDEAPAICDVFACQSNEFMCTLGSCIMLGFKCDGEYDCADGSDEIDCENKSCGLGFYQCRSKECIEMRRRCDGQQDCIDVSDEEDCEEVPFLAPEEDAPPHCAEGEYTCELNRSICLPRTARCNMKIDCPGGTDESDCDLRCAPHGMFECKQEYLCVTMSRLCNGHKDCLDGSDETPEACGKVNKTSQLYPPMVLPAQECRDGFLCSSGQCLEWGLVCNGVPHCVDASDENGLCSSACKNNTCAFSCQPTPKGPHCKCPPGLRVANQSCVDEDECALEVCSQQCHNVPGSFLCSCHHGYALRKDRRSCKAVTGDLAILYMSGNTVWSIAADGRGSMLFNDPKNAAIADMDVDVRKNKLYVSLTEAGELVEVNSTKSDVVVTNVGRPTKVSVDWITGNVYFVDSTPAASCIRVCNLWKKRCAKLQRLQNNTKITSLVVDPPSGRMFYCATRGSSSVVWSATLAGLRVVDLITARNCSGLAVDSFKQLLYVAETAPPRIFRIDFNGSNQRTILDEQMHLQVPHGLALFEDSIFFLITNSLKLNRCSLFGKKHCEPFIYRVLGADTFVLSHESAQRYDKPNLCEGFPCSNLCVLDEGGPLCVCDEGELPVGGACHLLEKEQLPLFNGWTSEQYLRAQHATLSAVAALLVLCALYLAVFVYYHFVHRARQVQASSYMEVRFQNAFANTSAPAATVVEFPETSSGGHEFVNPLEHVRDFWEQVRRQNRPIGTAGLSIDIPYEQQDLSDTESDLDEKENKNIVRNY